MNPKDYSEDVYQIIGAAMEVHKTLNGGLLEPIYNEALKMELESRNVEVQSEVFLPCYYKGQKMEKTYRMDLVVGDIIVELKSVSQIIPAHRAQLFNYLRLTQKKIGLLINFGGEKLEGERYVYLRETNECFLVDRNMNILHMNNVKEEQTWYEDPYATVN